ncbi:alpha/beta fold hydrolase [Pseudotabrizicola alkalilacus]|uniref:Alpha/beta fold hydrolase n=2 Tax=Pseudotabrizicola alkalilacus TaxID=2305252 RepID=A0A411Z3K9_9RHOB|nr:alpha/beta fold hydrolase [Pseudotabrizicola alkalilacus]
MSSTAQAEIQSLEFPYFTLRNRTGSPEPGDAYGGERSDLKAGLCRVEELDLGVLAPLADLAPNFLLEELLRVQDVQELDIATVLEGLAASAGERGPALYVHGYYIGFEKGCRRAALFQQNADLSGRFLWFSWPSDGAAAYYTHDEADLYWSLPDLADTIIKLEQRFGSKNVDVIGHSLGARGVILALAEVANRDPDIRLGHVVLLAPDVDFGIFERILPRIAPIAESITIYATTGDRPLALSAQLHGYPRLGEAGNDVSGLTGVEVIDLSDLPSEGPTGHLYHIYSRAVGEDLRRLLNAGERADGRQGLVVQSENVWRLRPTARE